MARLARAVIPGVPHNVTQRGNRRLVTFFEPDDPALYLEILTEECRRYSVEIWAYCVMPNHVHLIAVPETEDGLRRAMGETHRRYTAIINKRQGWTGHLWQGRFFSFPMDQRHTLAAARYVELNPVRAKMVERPQDYAWSSAVPHLQGRDDRLVRVAPLLDLIGERDWGAFLGAGTPAELEALREHETTGRPLGDNDFVDRMELRMGRALRPRLRGPQPRGLLHPTPVGDSYGVPETPTLVDEGVVFGDAVAGGDARVH